MSLHLTPNRALPIPRDKQASPWRAYSVLVGAAAMTILDVSKVGVALPAIQKTLHGSDTSVQSMLVGYTVAYALLLLPSGRMGDLYSRHKTFVIGLALFIFASVACSISPNVQIFVAARIFQGLGAGVLMPQVLGIIQQLFSPTERAKPLAILAATLSASSVFGPVLAGTIMQLVPWDESWRALFWVNIAIGLFVFPAAIVWVRTPGGSEIKEKPKLRKFDWFGAILLVPAIVFLVAPLSIASESMKLITPAMFGVALVGLLFVVIFLVNEKMRVNAGRECLVPPEMYRYRHFATGVLISSAMYAAGTGGTLIITLTYQEVLGQTPLMTALWMLPAAAVTVLGASIAGRVVPQKAARLIMIGTSIGMLGLWFGSLVLAVASSSLLPLMLGLAFILTSFGTSLVNAPNQTLSLLKVPREQASVAGSLLQFGQRVGSAIGMGAVLIFYYQFFEHPTLKAGHSLGPVLALVLAGVFVMIALLITVGDLAVVKALDRRQKKSFQEITS